MNKPSQFIIPSHALVIQSGADVRFEANDLEEMKGLIEMWKKELLPHTFDDIDPTPSKAGRRKKDAETAT